jgi:ADP-ribosylglycohydrolase
MSQRMLHLLLGMAVGDSVGLPFEGLKAAKIARRLQGGPVRQSLLNGKGWISDDTETALLTLSALRQPGDLGCNMARLLRRWFWGIPPGVGLATVKSCLKMTVVGPKPRSGVNSAGNGGLMRALVVGVWAAEHDLDPMALAETICLPTHTHSLALDGSRVIAAAAHAACKGFSPRAAIEAALANTRTDDLHTRLAKVIAFDPARLSVPENPPGFVGYSLPIAFTLWIKHGSDIRAAVEEAIRLGGDTDSHAALGAGLCSLTASEAGTFDRDFPADWANSIADRPLSPVFIRSFALDESASRLPWFRMRLRNLWLLLIVLGHGFMRFVH